jgi:hypothetical protein
MDRGQLVSAALGHSLALSLLLTGEGRGAKARCLGRAPPKTPEGESPN